MLNSRHVSAFLSSKIPRVLPLRIASRAPKNTMALPKSQSRRVRGALLVAMCLCSLWSFSSWTFTKTEEVTTEEPRRNPEVLPLGVSGVKLVGEHPLIFSFLSMALCGALCYTENSSTGKLEFMNRVARCGTNCGSDYFTFQLIQNILCFASGLINALCIFEMGMTVSHQSGNTSHAGRLIMAGGAKFGHLLAAFCFGSFFAGYSKADTELIYSGRYSPNLLASALAVVAGCLVHYCKEHGGEGNNDTSECLLLFAFSQGIMNGITRRCQTLPICTTHFTGYLTDVGTLLGWCARDGVMGEKFLKAMLFAAGILFFGLGGVAAKELHESYSMQAALISAALMAAVAAPEGDVTIQLFVVTGRRFFELFPKIFFGRCEAEPSNPLDTVLSGPNSLGLFDPQMGRREGREAFKTQAVCAKKKDFQQTLLPAPPPEAPPPACDEAETTLRPPETATAPAAAEPVPSQGDVSPPAVPGTAPEERPLRPVDPARLSALLEGTQEMRLSTWVPLVDVRHLHQEKLSDCGAALRWEANSFSTSPAAPYVQNLKGQIEELARRIPCAGGGSIPFSTQCIFWGWLEVRLMQECLEVLAKCGRRKTPEALMCLAEDFRSIHQAVEQHFRPQEDGDSQISQDWIPSQVVDWSYLDQFLEEWLRAHGYTGNEVSTWCRSHVEYPLRLHKALLDYSLGNNQKSFRQTLNDVEAVIATAISDEGGSLLHHF
eukprot:s59_g29.t1